MTQRLTIVNRARSLLGSGRFNSEDDPAAVTSFEVYDAVVEDMLSKRDWSFSTPVRSLVRLSAAPGPDEKWAYQFQLPSDRIGPLRAVYDRKDWDAPFKCFEIREDRLLTDAEAIWVRYPRLSTMTDWPGYFRKLIVDACKSHYALSVREDQALYQRLTVEVYGSPDAGGAGGKVGDAMSLDSQGRPSPRLEMDEGPLIQARWAD